MIEEKLLAEIEKRCADARFGYGSVTIHSYHKDVSALLEDRKGLVAENERMRAELIERMNEA